MEFDASWLDLPANLEEACARAGQEQAVQTPTRAELATILSCIDLTTLQGDDTVQRVSDLCQKAKSPWASDGTLHRVAAVCVFPAFVKTAVESLQGSSVRVACVAGAFPHGLSSIGSRVVEVIDCVENGADEVDVVIRREYALSDDWQALHHDLRILRMASRKCHLKVILATGELRDPGRIYRAAMVAMMAGADFVKTSTGKESVNATLPAGVAMCAAIRRYGERSGRVVGIKPAGGIRTSDQALQWLTLVESELGPQWKTPERFRIGASGLFDDVVACWKAAS